MIFTNITGCSITEDVSQKSETESFEAVQSGVIFSIPNELSQDVIDQYSKRIDQILESLNQ